MSMSTDLDDLYSGRSDGIIRVIEDFNKLTVPTGTKEVTKMEQVSSSQQKVGFPKCPGERLCRSAHESVLSNLHTIRLSQNFAVVK